MIVKNLITSLLMSGTIATGGIQSDMDTASFNNVPKNANTQITGYSSYTKKQQYIDNTTDPNKDIVYSKYEQKQSNDTIYSNINSYQYSKFPYINNNGTKNRIYNEWRILNFIGANYYQSIITKRIDVDYIIEFADLQIDDNDQANIIIDIYQSNRTEYNENANKTNLKFIENYQPEGILIDTINYNYAIQGQLDIYLGQYFTDNQRQDYILIDIKPDPNYTLNGPINTLKPNDAIYPQYLYYNYIAIDTIYEVVDIPTLVFTIITLPFSFISQAFMPITLFPDTPYAINIGNLIIVGLTVLIVIFIIKKFRK